MGKNGQEGEGGNQKPWARKVTTWEERSEPFRHSSFTSLLISLTLELYLSSIISPQRTQCPPRSASGGARWRGGHIGEGEAAGCGQSPPPEGLTDHTTLVEEPVGGHGKKLKDLEGEKGEGKGGGER